MYISIDIGGTNARFGLFESTLDPRCLKQINLKVSDLQDYTKALEKITKVIKSLCPKPEAIGVSMVG